MQNKKPVNKWGVTLICLIGVAWILFFVFASYEMYTDDVGWMTLSIVLISVYFMPPLISLAAGIAEAALKLTTEDLFLATIDEIFVSLIVIYFTMGTAGVAHEFTWQVCAVSSALVVVAMALGYFITRGIIKLVTKR